MAYTNKAWCVGTAMVLAWFDDNVEDAKPYWSLWTSNGKNMLSSYCKIDLAESRQKLEDNISAAEENQVDETFTLRLNTSIGANKYVTQKTGYYASLLFRPCALPDGLRGVPTNSGGMVYLQPQQPRSIPELQALNDRLAGIEAMLLEREDEQPADDFQERQLPPPPAVSGMQKLFENPQVIGALVTVGTAIVEKLLGTLFPAGPGPRPAMQPAPAGIGAVIEVSDTMKLAISILNQYTETLDQDLMRLANLAEKQPEIFKAFLGQLRGTGGAQ